MILVAQWTPRWFNKPKYHILLHLVDHIRQYGPAILFATENFESKEKSTLRADDAYGIHTDQHRAVLVWIGTRSL